MDLIINLLIAFLIIIFILFLLSTEKINCNFSKKNFEIIIYYSKFEVDKYTGFENKISYSKKIKLW
jgi:hypothetical protein